MNLFRKRQSPSSSIDGSQASAARRFRASSPTNMEVVADPIPAANPIPGYPGVVPMDLLQDPVFTAALAAALANDPVFRAAFMGTPEFAAAVQTAVTDVLTDVLLPEVRTLAINAATKVVQNALPEVQAVAINAAIIAAVNAATEVVQNALPEVRTLAINAIINELETSFRSG